MDGAGSMIVVNGNTHEIDGVETVSWLDDPKVKEQQTDFNIRTRTIRMIIVHTIEGKLGKVRPGKGDPRTGFNQAKYQTQTARKVSWCYTICKNGLVICQNDPAKHFTWHAGGKVSDVNPISIGIEFDQELPSGDLYEDQLIAGAKFINGLCDAFEIQKQIMMKKGTPYLKTIHRLSGPNSGYDMVGVFAHSNQTENKPIGDCGPYIWPILRDNHNFETFDFGADEDLNTWKFRQQEIGVEADGIPLKNTVNKLKEMGYKNGIWANRNQSVSLSGA